MNFKSICRFEDMIAIGDSTAIYIFDDAALLHYVMYCSLFVLVKDCPVVYATLSNET